MERIQLNMFETSSKLAEVKAIYKAEIDMDSQPKITSSQDVYQILKSVYDEDIVEYKEEFMMLLFNRANQLMGWVKISSGGISGTVADPKVIFTLALQGNASSIVISHNHPSGNLEPSEADHKITKKLQKAGQLLDIQVLDHLIYTPKGYYSFADNGAM